jgi:alpha-galactosidase
MAPQPVVGLCHGLFENLATLSKIFNLKSEDEIAAHYCGINHFFWVTDFTVRGKPGYPMLAAKLRGGKRLDDLVGQAYKDAFGHVSVRSLVASELYEEFGVLPYFGDRHTVEFFGRYLTRTRDTLRKYKIHQTTIAERRKWARAARKRVQDWGEGRTPLPMTPSRETAADIMAARWANHQFLDVMNLPNIGQISNLPLGAVVETPGVVNATGFSPVSMGAMPAQLADLTLPHVYCQNLIVEAGIEGDWTKAYRALIADPLCSWLPVPAIKKMGRELLEANKQYLPQFFGKKAR